MHIGEGAGRLDLGMFSDYIVTMASCKAELLKSSFCKKEDGCKKVERDVCTNRTIRIVHRRFDIYTRLNTNLDGTWKNHKKIPILR